ncbi:hypothetical protein JCM16816_21050 [Thermoanaerobacter brockii subsp. lactiethylicus]
MCVKFCRLGDVLRKARDLTEQLLNLASPKDEGGAGGKDAGGGHLRHGSHLT